MSNFVLGGCVRVDGVKGNVACVPALEEATVIVAFTDGTVRKVLREDVVRTKGRPKNESAMAAAVLRCLSGVSSDVQECAPVCETECETACDETLEEDCAEQDSCCAAE